MAAGGENPSARDCIPGTDCDCGGARGLTLGDIAGRLRRPTGRPDPVEFDKRPGAFEATRDLPNGEIYVVGARLDGADWGVLLMVRGDDGVAAQACIDVDRARAIAADLNRMADIASGAVLP